MKKQLAFTIILFSILLYSCKTEKKQEGNKQIFWVNSLTIEADAGVGVIPCLQISRQPELENAEWEIFYDGIEGFNLNTGYYRKIEVSETTIPEDSIPADGSSKKYTLIKILEEKADPRWRLYDIWAVDKINDKTISISSGTERPHVELHLSDMRIVGTDGCNHIIGSIVNLTETEISFSDVAGTLMMCDDMTNADNFNNALSNVKTYSIENLILTFYDKDSNKLIEFKKID